MSLLNVPDEILLIIIKDLDLMTLCNLYYSCTRLRNIVCMQNVIKECILSLNSLATARTLKLGFIKDIAGHLIELNMCGVSDLYKTALLPVVKKMKNLKILDVSYTNITIVDFIDIYQSCPSIKSISINFLFGLSGSIKIPPNIILQCQDIFKYLDHVHFVGELNNLLYSKLALSILQKAKLNTLKYTVTEYDSTIYENEECEQMFEFDSFYMFLLNWKEKNSFYGHSDEMPIFSMLELKDYEFLTIVSMQFNRFRVYSSPMFVSFFSNNFNIPVECIQSATVRQVLCGNVVTMLWNKETTQFDDIFFKKLDKNLIQFFPYQFIHNSVNPLPPKYDWYYTTPENNEVTRDSAEYEPKFRKRRVVPPNSELNYDLVFREKETLKLSLLFECHRNPVTLPSSCDYLRKLTYLSLTGMVVYSGEFFNILFRSCDNLLTLNVEAHIVATCASAISRSVPLSHSIKNLRLVDKRVDFASLFSAFSQCKTLENIHIVDKSSEHNDLADPSLIFERCDNLYSLFVHVSLSDTARIKKLQMINNTKARFDKYYLNVEICTRSNICEMKYDPYIDVFNLNPMKYI